MKAISRVKVLINIEVPVFYGLFIVLIEHVALKRPKGMKLDKYNPEVVKQRTLDPAMISRL